MSEEVREILKYIEEAIPGNSLFSFDIKEKKVRFEAKAKFTLRELSLGIKKDYQYETDGTVLFIQAKDESQAWEKIEMFLRAKHPDLLKQFEEGTFNDLENEKAKTQSN